MNRIRTLTEGDIEYQGAEREREVRVGMTVAFDHGGEELWGYVMRVNAAKATCTLEAYEEEGWEVPLNRIEYAGWDNFDHVTTGPVPVHYFVKGYRLNTRTGEIAEVRSDGKGPDGKGGRRRKR